MEGRIVCVVVEDIVVQLASDDHNFAMSDTHDADGRHGLSCGLSSARSLERHRPLA